MKNFYISICIVNLAILSFNLIKFIKNFLLLKENFKDSNIDLWDFLKYPDNIYEEAMKNMDELERVLLELVHTVRQGEELILNIDLLHKEIKEKLSILEDQNRLNPHITNRYNKLNNIFNEAFDNSQLNIQKSYDLMDRASDYLKRG